MSVQKSKSIRSMDELETVVDCDFHATETEEILKRHLPRKYRQKVTDKFPPFYPPQSPFLPNSYSTGKVGADTKQHADVATTEEIQAGMEEMNADVVMYTPGRNLDLSTVRSDSFASAIATAYNDWILAEITDETKDDGIYSPILVAIQEPDKAAEEIDDRVGEDTFKAVFIASGGMSPPLGDEQYWPIYQAAEDHDLPLIFHASGANAFWHYPHMHMGMSRASESHMQAHPMFHWNNITSMIANGVVERFDVDYVMQECGIGWTAFLRERLDHVYSRMPEDVPHLERPPSEYFDDRFYFTSQPLEGINNREYLGHQLKMMNAEENLMFSSDYPHFDFDNPDYVFQKIRQTYGNEAVQNIFGRTALEVFDI